MVRFWHQIMLSSLAEKEYGIFFPSFIQAVAICQPACADTKPVTVPKKQMNRYFCQSS